MAWPEAGILAPGLFRRAFPWKRCFPVAPGRLKRRGCDEHSRSQWRDRAGFSPASLPPTSGAAVYPPAVLAVAAVILAGSAAGVLAARRRAGRDRASPTGCCG